MIYKWGSCLLDIAKNWLEYKKKKVVKNVTICLIKQLSMNSSDMVFNEDIAWSTEEGGD